MGLPRIPLGEIRRALVRFPNWLGDTVMAVPTLRALGAGVPGAELWCLGPWVHPLLEAEPGIARRIASPDGWRAHVDLALELRRAAIDLVLLLPNSFGTALSACMAGAAWRVGYRGDGRTALLTHPVDQALTPRHQVGAYLSLLKPLGVTATLTAPTLRVLQARREEARRLLTDVGLRPGDRAVAIHLGAAFGPSKLWPADRLAALATLLDRQGARPIFLGGASAGPLLRDVETRMAAPSCSVVGRDHPALLPALLAEFAVVVAADSGPAHVAAAVGVPVITLFGPTDPRLTAPMGEGHVPLWRQPACAPCFQPRCPIDHRCMRAIGVDEVAVAVFSRLDAGSAKDTGRAPP